MISCSRGCRHISCSCFFSRWMRRTCSATTHRRMMTARKSAKSLSSSSSMLNFTANSNLGSTISQKGLLKLLRNSRVIKIWP
ncbi:hypothetical protein UPYG_G00013940 [Umbra pygmaea]|uniref:Uncharacterized protein n=1 Tax=Umbra pygmaea TaxID=75934 RepID=A0ABD0XJF0_UMBPY